MIVFCFNYTLYRDILNYEIIIKKNNWHLPVWAWQGARYLKCIASFNPYYALMR